MAWEPAEGVLGPLFPDIDTPLDARYEDFLRTAGDDNLFDGEGVTGMHAIERILFALDTPQAVIAREATLPGYRPAAWPATQQEAEQFKSGLAARLVADAQRLVDRWEPRAIDLSGAFQGLISLMNEQQEKVVLAANHEEESRYAQRTLADMRDNLVGTRAIYALFVPWLATKPYGDSTNSDVQQAFERLDNTYAGVTGDAIPSPPSDWNSDFPSPSAQQSPFGHLYLSVVQEVDAHRSGSTVDTMNHVARLLGLPEFMGEN
jgi:iron uptake system component EfeO